MKTETAPAFVRLIERLRETGGVKTTDLANFVGVSQETVSRWQTGREAPRPKMQRFVSDLASRSITAPDEIRGWLYAWHPQLDGERAIELIHDDRPHDVLGVLDPMNAEVYV